MNFLDDQERARLKIQHKKERDKRICDRIKAVLLADKGWTPQQIAEALLISDQAARNHIEEYLSWAIDVITHKIVIHEDKTLNAEATIRFFQKIEKAYPNKTIVHVFCDNAPYYRNKTVKQYLETSKISLHFLPPYSPNLNPIERLWKWLKERVIYNTYYEDFEEFRDAIFGFFDILSTADMKSVLGQSLKSRVRDKFRSIQTPLINA